MHCFSVPYFEVPPPLSGVAGEPDAPPLVVAPGAVPEVPPDGADGEASLVPDGGAGAAGAGSAAGGVAVAAGCSVFPVVPLVPDSPPPRLQPTKLADNKLRSITMLDARRFCFIGIPFN